MNTDNIINIISENNLRPNKKLGQNFLCNEGLLKRIITVSSVNETDNILEIGPGLGALTEFLLNTAGSLTAVEIDSGLFAFLKQRFENKSKLTLIHNDFLKSEIEGNFNKVVSNLPYYNSSEVLFRLAERYQINEIYVMLQTEMAERILSKPGSQSYGALSVTLGLYYDTKILFEVDKRSFYPKPEISSSFISLKKKRTDDLKKDEIEIFHKIVKSAFWGRRKTLRKTLSDSPFFQIEKVLIKKILDELNIENEIRGEELSVEQYKAITKIYMQNI